MTTTSNNVVSPRTPSTPLVDANGQMTFVWVKFFQDMAQAVNSALTILGQFNGQIGANATVVSHTGTLANAIQHLSSAGVIQAGGIDFNITAPAFGQVLGTAVPAQLPSATDLAHGAVTLPVGAPSTTLGTAAFNNTGDFDPAGAAATAQTNAENFASNAANLTSGNLDIARMPSSGISVTITTAKLTGGGANGSMTFQNGILTASTPAT